MTPADLDALEQLKHDAETFDPIEAHEIGFAAFCRLRQAQRDRYRNALEAAAPALLRLARKGMEKQ